MKVKFSGSNIILSAESAEEARVLQAARANSERKERVRCSRTWVGDVDSETDHPALTLTLERLKPVDCDLDRKHAIAEPVVFPKFAESRPIREPIVRPEDSRWETFGQEMPLLQRIRAWVSAKWRTARGSRATSHG